MKFVFGFLSFILSFSYCWRPDVEKTLFTYNNFFCSENFWTKKKCIYYNKEYPNYHGHCYSFKEVSTENLETPLWVRFSPGESQKIRNEDYATTNITYYNKEGCTSYNSSTIKLNIACIQLHEEFFPNEQTFARLYDNCDDSNIFKEFEQYESHRWIAVLLSWSTGILFLFLLLISIIVALLLYCCQYQQIKRKKAEYKNSKRNTKKENEGEETEKQVIRFEDRNLKMKISPCKRIWKIIKSIFFIICIQIQNMLSLTLSVICLAIFDGDPTSSNYISVKEANIAVQNWLVIFIVIYITLDSIMLLCWINRHIISVFQVSVIYASYKEWLVYRYLKFCVVLYFIIYSFGRILLSIASRSYPNTLVLELTFPAFLENVIMFFGIVTPFILLLYDGIFTTIFDGVGSIELVRRLKKLSFIQILAFPEINNGLTVILSGNPQKFLNNCFVCLSMINSKKDLLKFSKSDEFKHLKWKYFEDIDEMELLYLKAFFFSIRDNLLEEQAFTDQFWFDPPLDKEWIEKFVVGVFKKKNKIQTKSKAVELKEDQPTKKIEAKITSPIEEEKIQQIYTKSYFK